MRTKDEKTFEKRVKSLQSRWVIKGVGSISNSPRWEDVYQRQFRLSAILQVLLLAFGWQESLGGCSADQTGMPWKVTTGLSGRAS